MFNFFQFVIVFLPSIIVKAPRALPPLPTVSVDLEGSGKSKRSKEGKNASAATISSPASCNNVFLAPKLVRSSLQQDRIWLMSFIWALSTSVNVWILYIYLLLCLFLLYLMKKKNPIFYRIVWLLGRGEGWKSHRRFPLKRVGAVTLNYYINRIG